MPCATESWRSRRRGATTLVVVVAVLMLFFGFAMVLATLSSSDLAGERRVERRLRARYVAESGLALAFDELTGGTGSFSVDRDLLDGRLRVHVHMDPARPGRMDVLSQGVVDGDAVHLLARCELDPVLASAGRTRTRAGGGLLVRQQLALPLDLWAGGDPVEMKPADPAVMARIRTYVDERTEEARKLWAEKLAPMGRRRIHALCRQAVDRLVGEDG